MALPPARCSPRPKPCSRTSANCESDDANHRKSSSSSQIEAVRAQCGLYSRDIGGASVAQQVSTRSDDQPTKLGQGELLIDIAAVAPQDRSTVPLPFGGRCPQRAVVLNADLHLVVRHVQARHELAMLVEYAELRPGWRQTRVD